MAPDKPTSRYHSFRKGRTHRGGRRGAGLVAIIEKLNKLGGENGVGIPDIVENRLVGMKSRGVYETPGGAVLYAAHQKLEEITLDKETAHYKAQVAMKFGDLVYNGQWYPAA